MSRLLLDTNIVRHVATRQLGRTASPGILDAELAAADKLFHMAARGIVTLVVPDAARRELYGKVDDQLRRQSKELLDLCDVERRSTFPIEFPISFWTDEQAKLIRKIQEEGVESAGLSKKDAALCATAVASGCLMLVTLDKFANPERSPAREWLKSKYHVSVCRPQEALKILDP